MDIPSSTVMKRAIDIARQNYKIGGHAVAAIIVKDNTIVAEAFTTIRRDQDPTAHAEMNAIRQATIALNNRYLAGCYLYTTYEPCPMCTSAAIWAKMSGIVYGASRLDETPQAHWRVQIPAREVVARGTPSLELHEDFMRSECRELLYLT